MCSLLGRICSFGVKTLENKTLHIERLVLSVAINRHIHFLPRATHHVLTRCYSSSQGIQSSISSLQLKKRPARKKQLVSEDQTRENIVVAFSTAEEYDLERLVKGLKVQDLYETKSVDSNPDAVHAVAKYSAGGQSRDIFFFREGSVVLWNVSDLESSNLLRLLRSYQHDSYDDNIVQDESEFMNFSYQENR